MQFQVRKKNSCFRVRKKLKARKKFRNASGSLALYVSMFPTARINPSKLSWILGEQREKQKNPKSN